MSRYVILGHGGFDPASGRDPKEVLVPPGTSLKFFSDAGQPLVIPGRSFTGSDGASTVKSHYREVVKVWDHFKQHESPIPEKWVTYNFGLYPDDTEEERKVAKLLDWGAELLMVGDAFPDVIHLCEGNADTCPTPALRVQQQKFEKGEGDPVPDDRWFHHCNGILGRYAGHELFWLCCSSFMIDTPEVGVLGTAGSAGPGLKVEGWVPTDADLTTINELNAKNVKDTADGDSVPIAVGGVLLLVGSGHSAQAAAYLERQGDLEEGQLWVEKGGVLSRGGLQVQGISASKHDLVRSSVALFSKKTVEFVDSPPTPTRRGNTGTITDPSSTDDTGSDSDSGATAAEITDVPTWVTEFQKRVVADAEAAAREFDELPEAQRTQVRAEDDIKAWEEARAVVEAAKRENVSAFNDAWSAAAAHRDDVTGWITGLPAYWKPFSGFLQGLFQDALLQDDAAFVKRYDEIVGWMPDTILARMGKDESFKKARSLRATLKPAPKR